eukprot:CAMPEP_0177223308 /NCGR_PEP_ID=MMETSP0367-20130122/38405_1 /TAXON_ID=447022 ORGANISM="Scrippsiella hangoei-like, Strain SHHI-4" /NCGR_SAMPLE_ID=MMETSP0367 /ASSEMBLY_ACC=CAM_ASM_000362 /LENGTH=30 /DNA_ID= /DNA_START= /DNA_END= /DNA_ORIENTATION=
MKSSSQAAAFGSLFPSELPEPQYRGIPRCR